MLAFMVNTVSGIDQKVVRRRASMKREVAGRRWAGIRKGWWGMVRGGWGKIF
jgi:hypothetical protein